MMPSTLTSGSYQERCLALFQKALFVGLTQEQFEAEIARWDIDEIRALALTTQTFYRVTRAVWIDRAIQSKEQENEEVASPDPRGGSSAGPAVGL